MAALREQNYPLRGSQWSKEGDAFARFARGKWGMPKDLMTSLLKSFLGRCYRLNCVPANLYVEALTPNRLHLEIMSLRGN